MIEIIIGSNFTDSITGGSFAGGGTVNFLFKGKEEGDVLTGFNSNDTLNGGKGGDTLRGVGGDDTLLGRKGAETCPGGNGIDIGKGGPGFDECQERRAGVQLRLSRTSGGEPEPGLNRSTAEAPRTGPLRGAGSVSVLPQPGRSQAICV